MAQEEGQQQPPERMQALFPAPPPFYKHFTKANVAELRRKRQQAGASSNTIGEDSNLDGPEDRDVDIRSNPELRFLLPPPPPPADGTFKVFGQEHSLASPTPNLADLEVDQLYPDHPSVRLNPQSYLLSLARSQLTTFLALTGTLSQNAVEYERFTKDLDTIAYNMHDLINQYRPHQARETLILMMEERVEKMKGEVRAIREAKDKVHKAIDGLQVEDTGRDSHVERDELTENERAEAEAPSAQTNAKRRARQKNAWAALQELRSES